MQKSEEMKREWDGRERLSKDSAEERAVYWAWQQAVRRTQSMRDEKQNGDGH